MNPAILQLPFFQVTLPILVGFIAVGVWQNKRIDDFRADLKEFRAEVRGEMKARFSEANTRFDQVNQRLDHIDETLKTYGQKIAVLEDRSSPLTRR